jgi:hypothetical protein
MCISTFVPASARRTQGGKMLTHTPLHSSLVRATLCFAHTERSHSAGIIPRRPSGGTEVPSRFPGRPWPSNLD